MLQLASFLHLGIAMATRIVNHSSTLLIFTFCLTFQFSQELQPSQFEAIATIKKQLNFPETLTTWTDNTDFCNIEPNQILTLVCYEDNITQLHVNGNNWFPNLPQDFSTVPFFSTLANLPSLKVLTLVSLGFKGPLPANIGSLSSLEILNVSSNQFDGSLPEEISSLKNLQTLVLDHNKFTGQVPFWVGSLRSLSVLSLKNNSFSGSLPSWLSSLRNLRTLILASNNFSGDVPVLQNLTNLQVLDLEDNSFGPQFPSLPTKLVSLVLRKNKLQFAPLLNNLSSSYQLQKIDISLNDIVGPFSPSILSMPSLTYLDIAGNRLTGKLSKAMSCNARLNFVNISSNRLTGELPSCLRSNLGGKVVEYDGNCLSWRYKKQHPYSFCRSEALAVKISPEKEEKGQHGKVVLASSMVGGIIGGTVVVALALFVVRREHVKKKLPEKTHIKLIVEKVSPAYTLKMLQDARYISETMKLGPLGIPPYRTFVLDQLKEATDNFHPSTLIGEGPHGQVYRGRLPDGTVVAIRSLNMTKRQGEQTYTHQLEIVSKLRHHHLVSSIGHCFECHQEDSSVTRIYLVFEYMPNGTLRSFISEGHPGRRFTWTQRIAAAIGIARGIQFLHTGIVPGIYSNQLKLKDVLLDQDLHVKINKYNLPLLTDCMRLGGTGVSSRGSKDNAERRLRHQEKDDLYDFGVILLEILVGRTMISKNDVHVSKDILSVSLATDEIARRSIVDPAIHKDFSDNSLRTMIELCIRCLSDQPIDRPSIEDVIWNLQFAAQVQDSWQRDPNSCQGSPANIS